MTSTAGTDPHPEVAEISALAEGILPAERASDIREHIAGCSLCADVQDSLEEIRGLLGTLPGPQRMPADIVGRIDAALAAEALLDATRPDVPRETSTAPSAADVPRGTSDTRNARKATGAPGTPHGHASAPTGPGRLERNGRRWRAGLLTAASVAAVLTLGVVVFNAGGNEASKDAASSDTKVNSVAESVESQVRQLLDGPTTGTADSPMLSGQGQDGGGSAGAKRAGASVPGCVLKATQRSGTPLAAGREPFEGQDAYLVVLPHPGDGASIDAFVVSASCTATSPGAVLFQDTYPR